MRYWIYDNDGRLRGAMDVTAETRRRIERLGYQCRAVSGGRG